MPGPMDGLRPGREFDLTPRKRCEAAGCDETAVLLTARHGRYAQWCEPHAYREVGKVGTMVVRRIGKAE